jgi:copper(I)-binding protein
MTRSADRGPLKSGEPRRAVRKAAIVLAAVACIWGGAARAQVVVAGAWARATAPHQDTGVVYLSLTAPHGDTLTDISTPDAGMGMLHRTTHQGGMSGMADVESLALPPGRTVTFSPGALHIMLMELKHPLVAGSAVSLNLTFAHAGVVHVQVPVQPIGASGPPG